MEENTNTSNAGSTEVKKGEARPLTMQNAIILNAVIIGVSILIGALILSQGSLGGLLGSQKSGTSEEAGAVDIKNVNFTGVPFVGNPNAPVVLVYWSDFQCPVCQTFEEEILSLIMENEVADGEVAVVFKDFQFLGDDSFTAGVYSRSVWSLYPEQYYAWRTAMFAAQDNENGGFGDATSIMTLTATIPGIDASLVKADVEKNGDAYFKAMEADKEEGAKFGAKGTPTFITGTQLVRGLTDYPTLAKLFEDQLKK